jgi:hypothetical protein
MKPAGRGTQNRDAIVRSTPSTWSGRLEQIPLNYAGWKVRKNPATGEVFFLTYPLQKLRLLSRRNLEELESKLGGFRLEVFDL